MTARNQKEKHVKETYTVHINVSISPHRGLISRKCFSFLAIKAKNIYSNHEIRRLKKRHVGSRFKLNTFSYFFKVQLSFLSFSIFFFVKKIQVF